MGGCCCCFSKRTEVNGPPAYFYVMESVEIEEQDPLTLKIFKVRPCEEDFKVSSMKSNHLRKGMDTDLQKSGLKGGVSSSPTSGNYGFVELSYPRASDERVPLSPHQAAASIFSGGLLVDTNLDTSIPDTYRPPPAPIPFNATLIVNQTPPVVQEIYGNKINGSLYSTNSNSVQETVSGDGHGTIAKLEELKESESKVEADLEINSLKDSEIQLPKLAKTIISEEEDGCPICLEEYDAENPKLTAKCDHRFHLPCILEWMERSENCPMCDQAMVFNPPIDL